METENDSKKPLSSTTGLKSKRKSQKRTKNQRADIKPMKSAQKEIAADTAHKANNSPSAITNGKIASATDKNEGLEISDYAIKNGIHIGEVWRMIRNGNLIAKPFAGRLYIFDELYQKPENTRQGAFASVRSTLLNTSSSINAWDGPIVDENELPKAKVPPIHQSTSSVNNSTSSYKPMEFQQKSLIQSKEENIELELPELPLMTQNKELNNQIPKGSFAPLTSNEHPELALLLDHLSLAKEENKEIIKLTQDTINKITEMSESIVSMKNEVIAAKSQQILTLKEQLELQGQEIRKLQQEKEDLEMLANSISSENI
ncbi:MAG: hypothetical protein R3B45_16090 [Bdellovibrionota bacterium]